jgi:hypothetical protein
MAHGKMVSSEIAALRAALAAEQAARQEAETRAAGAEAMVAHLKLQIAKLKRERFGVSAERGKPLRIDPGPAATVRRTRLSAGNANRDAMALAWRFLDYPLGPHFDLPASGEVVLVEEALRGAEPEL